MVALPQPQVRRKQVDFALIALVAAHAIALIGFWFVGHWHYLPSWLPQVDTNLMGFINFLIEPILAIIVGIPLLGMSLGVTIVLLSEIVMRCFNRSFGATGLPAILLLVHLAGIGGFVVRDQIDTQLLRAGARAYNPAIAAIERYREDHGRYPATLAELVPAYLPAVPVSTMQFGDRLTYKPPSQSFHDYTPFVFELIGNLGIHGQTLKYCPEAIIPCIDTDRHFTYIRIDEHWILVYSSAL